MGGRYAGIGGHQHASDGMTPADLAAIGRLLHGESWQRALAADLDLTRDVLQNYAMGRSKIPADLSARIAPLVRARIEALRRVAKMMR